MLGRTRVFAVGVGGANGVYENLLRMGLSHMTVMDFDRIDASNLVTQGWFADQIGTAKVEAFRANAARLVPDPARLDDRPTIHDANMLDLNDAELIAMTKDADLLLFMTDDFNAQARGNRLALKLGKPAIFAMMYTQAHCSEITFKISGVTPDCHRCAVSSRYTAYLDEGFTNDVGSVRARGVISAL